MFTKIIRQEVAIKVLKVALFGSLSLCAGFAAVAQQKPISNNRELNAALKTAKTAEDHRRIADYYQSKAQTLLKKEKEERELANYYATHPSMYGKLYPTPYDNHKWRADSYQREANEAMKKASEQQESVGVK